LVFFQENISNLEQRAVSLFTPAAMALAFVREKWFVNSTIIGATTLQQLEQDIDNGSVCLSDDLLAEIDSIHQRFPNPAL